MRTAFQRCDFRRGLRQKVLFKRQRRDHSLLPPQIRQALVDQDPIKPCFSYKRADGASAVSGAPGRPPPAPDRALLPGFDIAVSEAVKLILIFLNKACKAVLHHVIHASPYAQTARFSPLRRCPRQRPAPRRHRTASKTRRRSFDLKRQVSRKRRSCVRKGTAPVFQTKPPPPSHPRLYHAKFLRRPAPLPANARAVTRRQRRTARRRRHGAIPPAYPGRRRFPE